MRFKFFVFFIALLVMFSPVVFSQSKETGAIIGTIVDEEGTPLPGVTVTASSPKIMGERAVITDAEGEYRFPALPPGNYAIKAELEGFATTIRENIRLTTTTRLTVDLAMKLSSMEEEVTVIAVSPTVDVKTSETASVTLSDEMLRALPSNQFVTGIINMAPGVTSDVAYGSSSDTGISYQVDGVDVSDPEGGSAWVFLDYNILEEAKVMGIGLNAEYGAFTGVIFNTITKSGGNEFSGHAEFIFQDTKKGFWSAENNQKYLEDFPDLESPVKGALDTSFHLGGPIKKDKIWFFGGLQYARLKERPAGFPEYWDRMMPRGFLKISSQLSSRLNMSVFYEHDEYTVDNRRASATHPPETCVHQTSPDEVGNFNLTYVLSPQTFFDIKASFFLGIYYLDPYNSLDTTAVFDSELNSWLNNSNWWYKADRSRYQANASISHFAEDFIKGNHDFKFGGEFERGWAQSRFAYTGYVEGIGHNVYIYDYVYDGYHYLYAYQYEGYDLNTSYIRTDLFAQDSWAITDNFTLNLGIRYSINRGYLKDVSGAQYKTQRLAPRIGFAWDIFGDHSTVLKGHYGQFTEAMYTGFLDAARPGAIKPFNYWEGGSFGGDPNDWYIWKQDIFNYTLASDIKHPYMNQYTVGIERELFKNTSLGVSFIYRDWQNFVGRIQPDSTYEIGTVSDPWTDDIYSVYRQTNVSDIRNLTITNLVKEGWILEEPYRNYWAIEVLFNKRFSDRWQLLASYLYSQCKGTMDNSFGGDIGWQGSVFSNPMGDPNFWINQDGRSTVDPTHMLKVQGTYILPLDIHFNASFSYITGDTYTPLIRPRLPQGRRYIKTEERGSRRYPDWMNLDLRLEKTFTFADKYRIGLMMDVFNVLNDDTVTWWGERVDYDWSPHQFDPTAPGPDGHTVYNLVSPRAFRIGLRFFF
jgi:outer membrane receptor protein involved in Fe transport